MIYNVIMKHPEKEHILIDNKLIIVRDTDINYYRVVNTSASTIWEDSFLTKEEAEEKIKNYKNKFLYKIEIIN